MSFIYIIKKYTDFEIHRKIGVSKNNCNKRLKQLQTGSSEKLELEYVFETQYPYTIEKNLHNKFKEKKLLNEWFILNEEDVNSIDYYIKLDEKNLRTLEENSTLNLNFK